MKRKTMKKYRFYLLAALLPALVLSCSKNEEVDIQGNEPVSGQSSSSGKPSDNPIPDGYIRLTLAADVENIATSKTSLDEGDVAGEKVIKWVNGDKVDVLFAGGSSTSTASVTEDHANFDIDVLPGTTKVFLSYPSGSGAVLDGETVSLTIPDKQSGAFAATGYLLASCTADAGSVTFYSAASFFKIQISDPTVKKAVITGNNEETLAGTVAYTFGESGLVPGEVTNPATTLTVNFNGTGDYYVAALPGLNLANGVTVKFFREGDTPAGGNRTEKALSVERRHIASFGDNDKICSRYVSTSGSGSDNGRTTDKPWSVDQFIAFINNGASTTYSDKLKAQNGLTVHIAAGDYTMPNVDINLGGDFTHLTIKGEDGARFVGDGSNPIIHQNKDNRQNTTVVFDNIVFTGGRRSSDHGGAIFQRNGTLIYKNCTFTDNQTLTDGMHGGALHYYGTPVASFENCTFSGNSTLGNGGVVNSSSGGSGYPKLTFTRCKFYNNTASGNGGVLTATAGNAHILFSDCDFGDGTEENKNSATNGGAIYFENAWRFNLENCHFKVNSASSGGAIYWNTNVKSATAQANIKGCSFEGNYSTSNGGALYLTSQDESTNHTLNIEKLSDNPSSFIGNHSNGQGGVIAVNGVDLNDTGSVYESNYAKSYGGVFLVGNSRVSKVVITSSRFGADGNSGKKNYSEEKGGGVLNLNGGNITLDKCEFYGNGSLNQGGVIRRGRDEYDSFELNIKGCTFKSNIVSAEQQEGGAIYFMDGALTLQKADDGTRNTFSQNQSNGGGGALCVGGQSVIKVSESDFSGNKTEYDGTTAVGGAIKISGSDTAVPDVTFIDCSFRSNTSSSGGGAIGFKAGKLLAKFDKCLFNSNYSTKDGGAMRFVDKDAVVYCNACVFAGDHSDSYYGTEIVSDSGKSVKLCMNNITIADGTYSKSGNGQQSAWVNLRNSTSLVMSNCTLIGVTRNAEGPVNNTYPNLLRIDGERTNGATVTLINNIIAQTPATGTYYSSDMSSVDVIGYFNKFSAVRQGTKYNSGDGSASDFRGTSDYFGGLSYVAPSSASDWAWNNCYWSWNGTMATGSDLTKATLVNVNTKIETADSDFHTWLSGIGALTTDGRGKARGDVTWPGAYDGSNN